MKHRKSSHRVMALSGALLAALTSILAEATTITEYPIPTTESEPVSIVGGPDGNLWFTEFESDKVGKMTPSGAVTEIALPKASAPTAIVSGPDGNLWITENGRNKIGKITPSGVLTEFPLPFAFSNVISIAKGSDGNLWFTESRCSHCDPNAPGQLPNDGAVIGKITPSGTISEFALPAVFIDGVIPTYSSGPHGITSGPDGSLWFTEYDGNKIGRITPAGVITEFPLPVARSFPSGITTGPDGDLWFVESRCVQCENGSALPGNVEVIGRITTAGVITEFTTPSNSWFDGPLSIGIVTGLDGNVWFTEPGFDSTKFDSGDKIGMITPAGVITELHVPTQRSEPLSITNGPDGALWFVERAMNGAGENHIGKIAIDAAATNPGTGMTISAGITGNWFNSSESGHGFSVEVLPGNKMLTEWFVFAPDGGQAWIIATGAITGNTAVLQGSYLVGTGGRFPPNFISSEINEQFWGTITLTFSDCNHGQASWQPAVAGYTSGSMPIARLTMPAGLTCP